MGPVSRVEVAAGGAALVLFLWFGGYHGSAVVVFLVAGLVWWVDAAVFHTDWCWCDKGWVVSWLSGKQRPHKACGGKGRRPRLAHRLLRRRGN